MPNIKCECYGERMHKTSLDRSSITVHIMFWVKQTLISLDYTIYTLHITWNYTANDKPFRLQIAWIQGVLSYFDTN